KFTIFQLFSYELSIKVILLNSGDYITITLVLF
ncbi:MAG: hypothetical protein ACI8WI_001686, partial [Pseudoalteromonas distincta]